MVDVTHEGDDRGAQLELLFRFVRFGFRLLDDLLDLVDAATFFALFTLKNKSVRVADFLRDVRLDRLVGRHENLQSDEILHDLKRFQPHLLGQDTDDDWRLDADRVAVEIGRAHV